MTDSQPPTPSFSYLDPGVLVDGELSLVLIETVPAWQVHDGQAPCYRFQMRVNDQPAGHLNLRIGSMPGVVLYAGHIGYGVVEAFRGRRFAERASRLVLPLARRHGLTTLWITCNPDNAPSRRTCERLGARYVETVRLPVDSDMYARGEREKCRYRLELEPVTTSPAEGMSLRSS